jgi:very-short-patch-repair endonuclease
MQERARELRQELTPAEKKLWAYLRGDQLAGWHWRRQHAVGTYIVDFFCARAKLVVEVDGDTHAEPEQADYDIERTRWLTQEKGYTVIRFTNHEIFQQTEAVVLQIIKQCQASLAIKDR